MCRYQVDGRPSYVTSQVCVDTHMSIFIGPGSEGESLHDEEEEEEGEAEDSESEWEDGLGGTMNDFIDFETESGAVSPQRLLHGYPSKSKAGAIKNRDAANQRREREKAKKQASLLRLRLSKLRKELKALKEQASRGGSAADHASVGMEIEHVQTEIARVEAQLDGNSDEDVDASQFRMESSRL